MDSARCFEDGQIYLAHVFSRLPLADLERMRNHLVCMECGGRAFYRKRSRSGQAACFGARHVGDCPYSDTFQQSTRVDEDESQIIRDNTGDRIQIDFQFGSKDRKSIAFHDDLKNALRRGGHHNRGPVEPSAMHRRLGSLLLTLIVNEQFTRSDQVVCNGDSEMLVRDFFVHFSDVGAGHVQRRRGYWGLVASASISAKTGALWLNGANQSHVSILIPQEMIPDFNNRFRITQIEDLAGVHILVIGSLRTKKDGKFFVRCEDLGFITIKRHRC